MLCRAGAEMAKTFSIPIANAKAGKKAQAIVIDLLAACLVFLLVATSINIAWTNRTAETERQLLEKDMRTKAEKALDTMIRSGGMTTSGQSNWEELEIGAIDQITSIGLAKRDLALDLAKVEKFDLLDDSAGAGTNYEKLKTKLSVSPNDFRFRIIDPNQPEGSLIDELVVVGKSVEGKEQATIRRAVIFSYARGGEAEAMHEAMAELTLYSAYR